MSQNGMNFSKSPRSPALILVTAFISISSGPAISSANTKPEALDFFEKKIRPLLVERCYECHSAQAKKLKGNLRLDFRDGWLKGGASGPAIIPGSPEKSLLIKAIGYLDEELQMPPKHKLSADQIETLEQWVRMGAPAPTDSTNNLSAQYGVDIEQGRKFWSFQPIARPTPPEVADSRWPRTDIDRFVLARVERHQSAPAPDASRRVLIRRATFDLIGLPPTPQEIDAFLADKSPNAFAKVVERLLASPHYGERWGRHWLDLARYADTSGCNSDFPIPTACKYRDYVINAFNRDKPYEQFVREQIAGDLLPAQSDEQRYEQIIATGYLAISRRFGSRNNEFHLTIEDTIDNMGKTMLGLSVGCARCHDHKFDPIPTRDYYALYGIFNSTRYAFPGTEIYRHPKDFVPLTSKTNAEAVAQYQAELASLDDEIEKLNEEKRKLEREAESGESKSEKNEDKDSDSRLLKVKASLEDARSKQRKLEAQPPDVEKAYAVAEGKPANAKVQKKGEPHNLGDEVPRGFLQVLGGASLPEEQTGSGRLELAQWLTDPKNPLLARVMVNRIWQHHFGRGIVETPNDFGARGKPPADRELLDFLAAKFIESGYSIKAMHRLMMLSHTYAMASAESGRTRSAVSRISYQKSGARRNASLPPTAEADAFITGFQPRRLGAEEIRDAMLAVSGALDPKPGDPHPFPPEKDWHYTQHKPFVAVYESNHRSIYLMQQRIKKQPFLELFDGADTNASVGERPHSTTPLQALFLMNDKFLHEQAEKFATRISLAFPEEGRRIQFAYRLAFGRNATPEEIRQAQAFVKQCSNELAKTSISTEQQPHAALSSLCRVLLSSNEFLFVD
jgi:hypothetical protein